MALAGIAIDKISFAYPRNGGRLVDVSLEVREAEVCCLLGPNGAGKTTLLRCLLGLLTPARGAILVNGRNVSSISARQLARLVAYVPQGAATPFAFTALDIAVMGRTPHLGATATPSHRDRRFAKAQLARLGIERLADRAFSKLSGGERQLTLLARALTQETPVLVLDEPTAALDYGNEVRLLGLVAELARAGKTVLMTTHQPAHALRYGSRAVLMRDGAVVADGRPADIMTGERLSALYGVEMHVAEVTIPGYGGESIMTCVAIP